MGQSAMSPDDPRHSFITAKYGLEGKREHFIPGNRRRGTGVREKVGFESEELALAAIDRRGWRGAHAYKCSICEKWHVARNDRHGDPRGRGLDG